MSDASYDHHDEQQEQAADWWSSSPLSSDSYDVVSAAFDHHNHHQPHDDLMQYHNAAAVEATTFATNMSCYSTAPTSVSAAADAAAVASASSVMPTLSWSGDELFCHEWFPCSHGGSVQAFLSQEQNGPLLRTLVSEWRRMGSPVLESVEQLRQAQRELGGENEHIPADLDELAASQEQVIVHTLVKALNSTVIVVTKPFSAFAGQLGLFSMIKAELFALQQQMHGGAVLDRAQLYHHIWMATLDTFDKGRNGCHNNEQLHLCLGDLIWGKAYRLSLDVLQYSYTGYLMQLKGTPLPPPPMATTSASSALPPPSPSVHSWLVEQTRSSRKSEASASSWLAQTELHFDDAQPPPAYEEEQQQQQQQQQQQKQVHNIVVTNDAKTAAPAPPSIVPNRRGAMSPNQLQLLQDNMLVFWNSAGFFDDVVHSPQDGVRAESPEVMTADTTMTVAPQLPETTHPNNDHARQWPTKLWNLSTAPPVRTYSLEISPKGTTTSCCYEGLLLPLRPLPAVSEAAKTATRTTSPMKNVVTIGSPHDEMSRSVSPAMLSRSFSGSSSNGHDVIVVNELLSAPTQRPSHTRSHSQRSNLSILSGNDESGADDDVKQRTRDAGRLRSQRHHQRMMTQRGVLNDAVEGLRQVTRELWSKGCANTVMASAMMRALTEVPQQLTAADEEPTSKSTSRTKKTTANAAPGVRANFNARKRDSKKKMRSMDLQNVMILMRVAAAIVDVPLQHLAQLPAMAGADGRNAMVTLAESSLSAEDAAQNAVLHVWLSLRHGWADIVMAEKRFFASGPPSEECVSTSAVIQLLQMGLR